MKTVKTAALPVALTVPVAQAPAAPVTVAPKADKLSATELDILAAAAPLSPVVPPKPVKAEVCKPVPQRAAIFAAGSLLELVQAMDGSKEARYNVALDAVTAAYSTALTFGNKSELIAVLQSTGRKVCERAMRTAIQTVGALGYHKEVATRQDAINAAVATAMTIFADIACKAPVKRSPAAPAADAAPVADAGPVAGPAAESASAPMDIVGYAAMLPDLELGALIESLLAVAASRHTPMLKAA